jgi:hypothetical protein
VVGWITGAVLLGGGYDSEAESPARTCSFSQRGKGCPVAARADASSAAACRKA